MKDIRILLSNPEGAVNLGFVARAMANTGFTSLSLTGKLNPLHPTALKYALAAENILQSAEKCVDFEKLVSQADKVIGISMRTPQTEHANIPLSSLKEYIGGLREKGLSAGLLFGNEKAGLSNAQLSRCSVFVSLDTSDTFPSMNLAQAVLVVLWELKDIKPQTYEQVGYADRKLQNALLEKISLFLNTFGCLNPQNPEKISDELRQSIESKMLTEREVSVTLAILGKAIAEHTRIIKRQQENS